jgi:hypothetical protein
MVLQANYKKKYFKVLAAPNHLKKYKIQGFLYSK